MNFDYSIITKPEELAGVNDVLKNDKLLAVDTETTGLSFMDDNIIGCSIANRSMAYYITGDALLPFANNLLGGWTRNPEKTFIGHNFLFDLHFFKKVDVLFPNPIIDTMLAAFMIDENSYIGLKPCAERYLRLDEKLPSFKDMQKELFEISKNDYKIALAEYRKTNPAGGTPLFGADDNPPVQRFLAINDIKGTDIPLPVFGRYGALDSRLTYDLWEKFEYFLKEQTTYDIFMNLEMPFIPVLFEMEERGVAIDVPSMQELKVKYEKIKEEELQKFLGIAGDINPNSDKQMTKYLYEDRKFPVTLHTKSGTPSTDALAMQRLEPLDNSGAIKSLLTYRKYEKVLSTYVGPFLDIAKKQNIDQPRIHGSYNQTGTVTGRLSSSDPNLQNIPARHETGAEIRQLFIAKDGYELIVADYSQLELRILAHYANDEAYIQLFKDGGDPHQLTADLCKCIRRVGKTINFAWVYGAGPKKLCDTIEKDGSKRPELSEAKAWMASFETGRPCLVNWKERVISYAKKLGYVRTIAGRRRHLPELKSSDMTIRGRAERQSVNTIIQGSAGDIIKWAMVQISRELAEKSLDACILIQVHDELIVETRKDLVPVVKEIVERRMTEAGTHFNLKTPLVAEAHSARDWYSAKTG